MAVSLLKVRRVHIVLGLKEKMLKRDNIILKTQKLSLSGGNLRLIGI